MRKKLKQSRASYQAYSDKDRFLIEKDASIYVPSSATRKWKKTYSNLHESTVRGFRKCREAQIKDVHRKKKSPKKVIVNKLRGRPCLLGDEIDPLVQNYLKVTRHKGGVVNSLVAMATAKALLKRYPRQENLKILGSKYFSTYGLCSPYQNHWEGIYSGRGSKGSRAEILASNH